MSDASPDGAPSVPGHTGERPPKSPVHDELTHLPHHAPVLRRMLWVIVVIALLLAIGVGATVLRRAGQDSDLKEASAAHAQQHVTLATVKHAQGRQPLLLPGTLQGTIESPIYARSTGYVKRWSKDIGAKVRKGDLLAELDTPEIDQELAQALATRQQTASSLQLAKSTAERWESLRQKDAVTQQELDERRSAYAQGQSNLAASDANVRRLQQMEAFKRILAPFDGVVTRRNVDVGDLIDAGGGSGRALFTVAQVDPLRIYLYVPQADAQRITVGENVEVRQAEQSGPPLIGKLVRSAGAIDTASRTLQVEVSLPNREGRLLAGAYVQVAVPVGDAVDALIVPTNTLLFRAAGTQAAVVGADHVVHLKQVRVGRDYGNTVELLGGVSDGERLVLNPSDSLEDGDKVTIAPPQSAASGASGSESGGGSASGAASGPAR